MRKLEYGLSSCGVTLIADLRLALGAEVAEAVTKELAGRRVYIPQRGTEKHQLFCDLFGEPAADFMAEHAGGTDIDFPSRYALQLRFRQEARRTDLANPSLTANEIAARHGITRRWATHLRREFLAGNHPNEETSR